MVTMESIDQMMVDAQQTQDMEIGDLQESQVFTVTGVQLNEASKIVVIYHRHTGEPRNLPRLAADIALRKRYRDHGPLHGQFIFSARPTKTYHYGKEKCLLHPDRPEREQYDIWGLPTCESGKIASPGEVINHMRLRHPSADRIIHEHRQKVERLEERASNNAIAESVRDAMQVLAGQQNGRTAGAVAEPVTMPPNAPLPATAVGCACGVSYQDTSAAKGGHARSKRHKNWLKRTTIK
jgi:hypothetical protein